MWESYLAITATIYAFNILKQHPVKYASPYPYPAVLDYDDKQLYTEAMKTNRADLDLTKNPPAIRDSEFFRIYKMNSDCRLRKHCPVCPSDTLPNFLVSVTGAEFCPLQPYPEGGHNFLRSNKIVVLIPQCDEY